MMFSEIAREYRDLYFWDLFFHRIYLFIEESLAISRFSRTLTVVLPLTLTIIIVFARTLTFVCILTLKIGDGVVLAYII